MLDAPGTTKWLPVCDGEIEYFEQGTGDALLLVHAGVFADWFAPMAAGPTLDGFRVIRVRRAGYGPNAPKHPLTLPEHADHLRALADFLQIKSLHLVGHSLSGLIAMQLASDHPELIRSMVLLEPAPCGPLQVPAFAEFAERYATPAMQAFAAGRLEDAYDTFMRGMCGAQHREVIEHSMGKPAYERIVRESSVFFRDEVPAAIQWTLGAAQIARIRQAVLIVEGSESSRQGSISGQVSESAKALLPQAEFVMIEGVNHMMPVQDPDGVGRVIAAFARRHPIVD